MTVRAQQHQDPEVHTVTSFTPPGQRAGQAPVVPQATTTITVTRPGLMWAWVGSSVVIDTLGALASAPHGVFALMAGLTGCGVVTVGTLVALTRWQERHMIPDFPVRVATPDNATSHREGQR